MLKLMTYAGEGDPTGTATRTGGVPLLPPDFAWPRCRDCGANLQFLAHLALDDLDWPGAGVPAGRVVEVFMCDNDGTCETWRPAAGANLALLLAADGLVAAVPPDGRTRLAEVSAVSYVPVDAPATTTGDDDDDTDHYGAARRDWGGVKGRTTRDVLGVLGGVPTLVNEVAPPACPGCAAPMAFVAHLEEGHDHRTAANFGGGLASVHACYPCVRAAFSWDQ